MGKMICV